MIDSNKREFSTDLLLCVTALMVCLLDAWWLSLPTRYGVLTPDTADGAGWVVGAFYHALFGSPVALLVMASGIVLLEPGRQVTAAFLWKNRVAKFAAAYVFWSFIYAMYRIHMMQPQPDVTKELIFQQWMTEPEHLWYLTIMIGLFILVPIMRPITASGNTKLFGYLIVLFIGALGVVTVLTWPGLSYGETYIFPALLKTPVALICQYFFWMLFGWIAYSHRPKGALKALIYLAGIAALIVGTWLNLQHDPYPFGEQAASVLGEYSLVSFCKNTAIFCLVVNIGDKLKPSGESGFFMQRLAGSTLTIYLIHVLILCLLFDHGVLLGSGMPLWAVLLIYGGLAWAAGAVVGMIVQGIWHVIRGSGGSEKQYLNEEERANEEHHQTR